MREWQMKRKASEAFISMCCSFFFLPLRCGAIFGTLLPRGSPALSLVMFSFSLSHAPSTARLGHFLLPGLKRISSACADSGRMMPAP